MNLNDFEKNINYFFKNKEFLTQALTHSSYANEHKLNKLNDNERLEFLGDAILEFVISKYIYSKYVNLPEGELTKLRATIVCENSLSDFSKKIDLGKYLLLGKGEDLSGGRNRSSILADAFEAIIGAIFLDGGIECAEKHILSTMHDTINDVNIIKSDSKTRLQEIIQSYSKQPIIYTKIGEEGPDHDKLFIIEVSHDSNVLGSGTGKSKKEAEQIAASNALLTLSE